MDVPAQYLDWVQDQPCIKHYPQMLKYIQANEKVITQELEEAGLI